MAWSSDLFRYHAFWVISTDTLFPFVPIVREINAFLEK